MLLIIEKIIFFTGIKTCGKESIDMKKRKVLTSIILSLLLINIFFSLLFLLTEVHHDCNHNYNEECPICIELEHCISKIQNPKEWFPNHSLFLSFSYILFLDILFTPLYKLCCSPITPITLKVKMTN